MPSALGLKLFRGSFIARQLIHGRKGLQIRSENNGLRPSCVRSPGGAKKIAWKRIKEDLHSCSPDHRDHGRQNRGGPWPSLDFEIWHFSVQ